MDLTRKLKLPQYSEEDIFDLQDINKAYNDIDNAYEEIINFKEEIPKVNANAEIIEARDGEETLGAKIRKFNEQLDTIEQYPLTIGNAENFNITEIDVCAKYNVKINKKYKYGNVKRYGAIGDGIADDTNSIQATFDFISYFGGKIYIPKGIYKVTKPITVLYDNDKQSSPTRPRISKIYGDGIGYASFSTIIYGYNIPDGRAVFEVLGTSNGWAVGFEICDIDIRQKDGCADKSYCLAYGDSYGGSINRVWLEGKNCLLLPCGCYNKTYAHINTNFNMCNFVVNNELWGGVKNAKGWAINHGGFYKDYGVAWDNIRFNGCYINGTSLVWATQCEFNQCLFTSNYLRPVATIVNKKTDGTHNIYDGLEIDFSTCIQVNYCSSLNISQCYFEEIGIGIDILPDVGGKSKIVTIDKCYFTGINNAKNAIRARNNNLRRNELALLDIKNCSFVTGYLANNDWFTDGILINENCKSVYVDKCFVTDGDKGENIFTYTSNYPLLLNSTNDHEKAKYKNTITFVSKNPLSTYTNDCKDELTNMNNYYVNQNSYISKVMLYYPRNLVYYGTLQVQIYVNDTVIPIVFDYANSSDYMNIEGENTLLTRVLNNKNYIKLSKNDKLTVKIVAGSSFNESGSIGKVMLEIAE